TPVPGRRRGPWRRQEHVRARCGVSEEPTQDRSRGGTRQPPKIAWEVWQNESSCLSLEAPDPMKMGAGGVIVGVALAPGGRPFCVWCPKPANESGLTPARLDLFEPDPVAPARP